MRNFFAVLLVILFTSFHLPAAWAAEEADHTLVIATSSPFEANPRLEYAFLNRYPDGRIVYLEYRNDDDGPTRLMAGQIPDLIELAAFEMTRYTNLNLIENLYEQVFPGGYPRALAQQARHLMELEGAMIGVPRDMTVSRWSIYQRYAKQQGFDIPADGWTIDDFMAYYDAFTPDTDGNGIPDVYFIMPTMTTDADWNPIITKYVGELLEHALINHLDDVDYFLTEDFIRQLEISKLLSTSDKVETLRDERGELIDPNGHTPTLFDYFGNDPGPYRAAARSSFASSVTIAMPVAREGEQSNPASVSYYCLMRGAPHHELAVECMRMMAEEDYQALYDASGAGDRARWFGAEEPSLQLTMTGGIYRRDEVFYSEEYHANVRIVDASMLDAYHVSELTPQSEQYQEQLDFMDQASVIFYDHRAVIEIKRVVFWPALKEYYAGNMTAEEVVRLLYQRLRIALYE